MPSPATLIVHGVLMEICGLGVLIRGPSGIGKGELALELISRGHRLIADDAPQISLSTSHSLSGNCPPLLRNLLEVRSLGVLNVAALFGEQAVASSTPLQLIVTLETIAESEISERDIAGLMHNTCRLLDVDIPGIRLALRAGRPTALLVETLVKNFKLQQQGYLAHADLSKRQRRAMDSS
jgi:HPr kinase/phosphorylase